MPTSDTPKSNLIRGAIWTVGTRWSIKAIGFINTVVMARLLAPEDYGVVAMGMLVVVLVQTFLDFSATIALLRKDEVTREEIDSAWTLRIIQGACAAVVLVAMSPFAVAYFEESRLQYILFTFALCMLLGSASNVGQTLALKNYEFTLDFKIQTISKVTSVLTTIVFGYYLHDYRALVLGIVAGYISPLVLSFLLHPYRPRFETSKIGEIWHVTKWLLVSNIGSFVLRKGDELIAGRIGSTHGFGLYNVGSDLGQLPVGEVGPAMLRALLPVLASIKEDAERIKGAVLKTLSGINTVVWPIGFGFAAVSHEATELILGKQWLEATPFVALFAVTAVLQTSIGSLKTFLVLKGATKVQSNIVWIEFASFALGAVVLVPSLHLLGLAWARLISSIVSSILTATATKRYCELDLVAVQKAVIRPIAGSLVMYLIVHEIAGTLSGLVPRLCAGVVAGAVFYSLFIFISWRYCGRPEGLESTINDRFHLFAER